MKIFLSWSGAQSQAIAKVFYDHLPDIIQAAQPFLSSDSIRVGNRWLISLAEELADTRFGIAFINGANQHAPWICFEAGALAKLVSDSSVFPILFNMKRSDLHLPMQQFQAIEFGKDTILTLISHINSKCASPLSSARLESAFERVWDTMERRVKEALEAYPTDAPQPSSSPEGQDLKDLILMVGDISQRLARIEGGQMQASEPRGIRRIVAGTQPDLVTSINVKITFQNERPSLIRKKSEELSLKLRNFGYEVGAFSYDRNELHFQMTSEDKVGTSEMKKIHDTIFTLFGPVNIATNSTILPRLFT